MSQDSHVVTSPTYIRKLNCQGREKIDGCRGEEVAEKNRLTLRSSFLETQNGMIFERDFPPAHEVLLYPGGTTNEMAWLYGYL